MRSEDSSSGESEEEEEAARMEICCKIYRTLLSPPLSCKHPTTVLVATYGSCSLHTRCIFILAWSSLSIIRRHNNYSFLYFTSLLCKTTHFIPFPSCV